MTFSDCFYTPISFLPITTLTMPKDKHEDEDDNVFKMPILVSLIKYLEAFDSTRHNLAPDEFLKSIYAPMKSKSVTPLNDACNSTQAFDPRKNVLQDFQVTPPCTALQRPIAHLFFEIIRLQPFMVNVIREFCRRRNGRGPNDVSAQIIVIAYVLIYRSSATLVSDVIACLMLFDVSKILALLSFLLTQEIDSLFYVAGCEFFDVDFVEQKILHPFVKALPVLQAVFSGLLQETKQRKPVTEKKKITIPVDMNVLKHPKKFPRPPVCTPETGSKIVVKAIPKTLYKPPNIESKIAALREENRKQANQRLEDSNMNAPACFKTEKSKRYKKVLREIAEARAKAGCRLIVAKKYPTFKNVPPVKKTLTTILREGARITSGEVKEIEKLKELMKGSFDPGEVQRLEDEMRQCEKEETLRKIEENHLSGLISYEESLLAKRQLIDEAREQGSAVRIEKEELNAKLEKYRVEEMEKLKRIVEKCHENERAVKYSYAIMADEKRQKAAEIAEESRRIKLYLMNQKEEELRRKLQLIKEIKTLQAIQELHTKEFDPTEKSKLGLMCEMSLAELKEKLLLTKEKWRDELIARKDAVKEHRQRQKDLVESAEKRISEYRVLKQSLSPPAPGAGEHNSKILLQTPQIQALRRKLEDRRMQRLQTTNSSSTTVLFKSKLLTNSAQ